MSFPPPLSLGLSLCLSAPLSLAVSLSAVHHRRRTLCRRPQIFVGFRVYAILLIYGFNPLFRFVTEIVWMDAAKTNVIRERE